MRIAIVFTLSSLLATGCELTVVDETSKRDGVDAGTASCTMCDGTCVDIAIDPGHCGACGRVCGVGEACVGGDCQSSECEPPLTQCGEVCVDTGSDASHCGGCGRSCTPGQRCEGGSCRDGADAGPGGGDACPDPAQESCGGECVNVLYDPNNCGACSRECGTEQYCEAGHCLQPGRCPDVLEQGTCGDGSCCYQPDVDPERCGGDCATCAFGQVCSDGTCRAAEERDVVFEAGRVTGLWSLVATGEANPVPICADAAFGVAEMVALCGSVGGAPSEVEVDGRESDEWWILDCPSGADLVSQCEISSASSCATDAEVFVYCDEVCP